jgi:hypothetical protein
MKLRTPQGKEIEATILTDKKNKGKIRVISTLETGQAETRTLGELEKCEIISATKEEKDLLGKAGIRIGGLAS